MKPQLRRISEQLIPLIILGIGLVLMVTVFVILSYVLIWGILVGCIIWLILKIRQTLFSKKSSTIQTAKSQSNRIIEHEEDER